MFTVSDFAPFAQLGGDLVAHVAIFFEGFVEDALKLGGHARIQGDRSYGSAVQNVVEDNRAGAAGEGQPAGGQLIEHAAKGKEIASSVEFLATRLFRRHVGDGADGRAGAGEEESFGIAESRAVEAGVFGYLVKPFREVDLLPAIQAARARHEELAALREQVDSLAEALAARKSIERAKGLLMEREGLSEQDAFARLRKASQVSGRPLRVVAEAVVATLAGE